MIPDGKQGVLYFGDNLVVLREHVPDESVDLIYLDPPFNSKQDYNILFAEQNGKRSRAQIKAFEDTWHWDLAAEETYAGIVERSPERISRLVQSLRGLLGENDVMAYLVMMTARLAELHRVLKPTGSIYLHCDPTASHYLKAVMDGIFDARNFRNEIVWKRSHPHGNVTRTYGAIHDVILFYSKGPKYTWTRPHKPYFLPSGNLDPEVADSVLSQYNLVEKGTGRRFQATSLLNPNPNRPNLTYKFHGHSKVWRWTRERMEQAEREGRIYIPRGGKGVPREKRYLDEQEGYPLQDIWSDIPFISPRAAERLGYPTQKPEALLERIILASSNKEDIVLDPFCGCGTAIAAAQKLGRRWIGIDITHLAIALIRHRLADQYGDGIEAQYEVHGTPADLGGARALAAEDRFQFEWWALALVNARPAGGKKKGADTGIDGYIFFHDEADAKKTKTILVQVKSGHVGVKDIRDFGHVLEREDAEMGFFVTLEPPTGPMKKEAVRMGFYESPWGQKKYPRMQLLTIEALLSGQEPKRPPRRQMDGTFRKAPKSKKPGPQTPEMF